MWFRNVILHRSIRCHLPIHPIANYGSSFTSIRCFQSSSCLLTTRNAKDPKAPKAPKKRPFNLKPINNLEDVPNDYTSVHTKYGWFAVPVKLYGYNWTVQQIETLVESKADDIDDLPHLQHLVNEWLKTLAPRDVPKLKKLTRKEIDELKEDEIYRRQLSGDIDIEIEEEQETKPSAQSDQDSDPDAPQKRTVKKVINFTHAWNYFFSLKYAESDLEYKVAKKEIAHLWKSFNLDEKNKYRQDYADLLKSGKDIHKGEVVDLDHKQKVNKNLNKYKRTLTKKKKLEEKRKYESNLTEEDLKDINELNHINKTNAVDLPEIIQSEPARLEEATIVK